MLEKSRLLWMQTGHRLQDRTKDCGRFGPGKLEHVDALTEVLKLDAAPSNFSHDFERFLDVRRG